MKAYRIMATLDAGTPKQQSGWARDDYDQPHEFPTAEQAQATIDIEYAPTLQPGSRRSYEVREVEAD